jgi:hypothetical protein
MITMKEKFFEWFGRNRITIGYTVGGVNVLNGVTSLALGDTLGGICFILVGSAIIFDSKVFK